MLVALSIRRSVFHTSDSLLGSGCHNAHLPAVFHFGAHHRLDAVAGVASSTPLKPLRRLFPFVVASFGSDGDIGFCSGNCRATTRLLNPILYSSWPIIVVGRAAHVRMQHRSSIIHRFPE